jgi:hypothetical protein
MAIYFQHHNLFRLDLIEVVRVSKIPPLCPPSTLLLILTKGVGFRLTLVKLFRTMSDKTYVIKMNPQKDKIVPRENERFKDINRNPIKR